MTTTTSRAILTAVVLALACGAVLGDGMIVPVRPDIRVRGSWAVKYHHVNVLVRDQIASVSIDQEFVNTSSGMIEVEYLFPVPPGAAIDSMTLIVDGKEFAARLLEADEARRIYENIVRQKKDPALLEYAGFGLYKTRAFPLQPGKPCKVIVTYKNVCRKDGDLVEVWYPLNTEKFSARAIDSVRVRVDIKSPADIGPVYSPTHSLKVERKDPRHVIATYEVEKALPTSDFQVFYQASNRKIGATLVAYARDPKKDGHFMMLVSPNPRGGKDQVLAKDVVAVFDHSGSMSGQKLDQAKQALIYVLQHLGGEDRFNVIVYNDTVEPCFDKLVDLAGGKNVAKALDVVDRLEATGGTNIHEALQVAMKTIAASRKGGDAKKPSPRPAYVIFMTDGLPTVGPTEEKDILADTAKANQGLGARLFTFGVGYQPNVRLLDKLADGHAGRSEYVKPKEAIETKVAKLYNKIKNPVMTSLTVALQGVKLRDVYPRELGDLFDGDQIVVFGRFDPRTVAKLPRKGDARRATLVIKGAYQGKERAFEYNVDLPDNAADSRFAFVEKIWAVRRVGYLMDQIQLHGKNKEVVDELIRLSKTYGIMTPYTSFLAEETTPLRVAAARDRAEGRLRELGGAVSGEEAHRAADMRKKLKSEDKTGPATAPPAPAPAKPADPHGRPRPGMPGRTGGDADGKGGKDLTPPTPPRELALRGTASYGSSTKADYEGEKVEYVAGVRTVGNMSLYRRGTVWVASSAGDLDPSKDQAKYTVVERYSKEYFELIRANNVDENKVMASQGEKEELLLRLRGKAYLVK